MATHWLDVLDETIRACAARHRADLVQQLQHKRAQLLDPKLRVLVAGAPKQGKSQLVNALINAPACVVGDDVTTTVPTVVTHADQPSAVLVTSPHAAAITGGSAAATRVPVQKPPRVRTPHAEGFVHLEVGVPRGLLQSGLVLIDMPPLAAPEAYDDAVLAQADAVLLVSDATRELSDAEVDFLRYAIRLCPNVILTLTKIDLVPGWRHVAERNLARLADEGVPAPQIPVSAELRLRAARTNDSTLNAESGFPELLGCLQRDVRTKADRLAPRTAAALAGNTIEALVAPLQAERTAQEADGTARLRDIQRSFDELRRHSTRWQTALADDIADLASDIEYDMRDRTRRIVRKVEEFFDVADPDVVWDSFTPWLAENLRNAAQANFAWLVQRSHWMATRIAANFAAYRREALPDSTFWLPDDVFESMAELERPSLGEFTLSQKVFTGLRGSYGGVVMFGLLTSLAGMPLINVVSLGAGALFGGKSLRDEGGSRLQRRQAAAKAAVQRHIEDFFLTFSKECRDVARQVHRALRDHFMSMAEELQEDLADAARIARQAAERDAAQRDRIQQEYENLVALHRKAHLLTAVGTAAGAHRPVAA
ncbi:MAG: GTP-binding protein [Actinobacteria bacterium 13_2_20CM_2_71_6]|nr:MAG: GTP-binding protein [Actinobacteria bacterium 13_2_20CM_2_71_6]